MVDVSKTGAFVRKESTFRSEVKRDGSTDFLPERDRYHLYVSMACPWAHRVLIVRALKGLEDVLPMTSVHYVMDTRGWRFVDDESEDDEGVATPEPLYQFKRLKDLYLKADPGYSGRITVPLLWDKKKETIVNNESKELIRMLNSEFDEFAKNPHVDLNPASLAQYIDDVGESFYDSVNNGVYRCGFATSQDAYAQAFGELFAQLDILENRLSQSKYLCGVFLTIADIRLFTTLIRFDSVYYGHFKTNLRRIKDYPNLSNYTRCIYQTPLVAATVAHGHIKKHYYMSHPSINPHSIVPGGPGDLEFEKPHDRDVKFP